QISARLAAPASWSNPKGTKLVRLLQSQPLQPGSQQADGLMVLFAQVIPGMLVRKFVQQEAVYVLSHALLKPAVAEPEDVEVQPPAAVAGGEVVGRVDEPD